MSHSLSVHDCHLFSLLNQTNGHNLIKYTTDMPWCMRSIPAHASQSHEKWRYSLTSLRGRARERYSVLACSGKYRSMPWVFCLSGEGKSLDQNLDKITRTDFPESKVRKMQGHRWRQHRTTQKRKISSPRVEINLWSSWESKRMLLITGRNRPLQIVRKLLFL